MKTEKSSSISFIDSTFYMLQKACQELYISHKELERKIISHKELERKIEQLRAWNTEALAENNKLDRQLDVFFEVLREVCANDKMKAKELRAMLCKVLDEHSALFDAATINDEVEP